MKKEVTLYNVMFPIWFLIVFPVAWIVILPANFIIDSIVLLISIKLLKLVNRKEFYKHTILKVWLIGFASDFIGAGILFLTTDGTGPWSEYLYSVSWNPFDNWYALLLVASAVLVSGIFIYIGNLKYSFKNMEAQLRHKKILALVLAIFTAPYIMFYPSSLMNGGSWEELDFFTNHIIKREEYRLEVTLNRDSMEKKTYIMSRYEHEVKDAINNADKIADRKPTGFQQPDYILAFYGRDYSSETTIPIYLTDNEGCFEYKNDWYEFSNTEILPFIRGVEKAQNMQGKQTFTITPDPKNYLPLETEPEELDKEGNSQSDYPVFQDSKNKYYIPERNLFDSVIQFQDQEKMDVFMALESGLISPQDLIDHGMPLVVEPRNENR